MCLAEVAGGRAAINCCLAVSKSVPNVPMAFQHASQWGGDICWRQSASRHLIEKWLEEMEIAAINQS